MSIRMRSGRCARAISTACCPSAARDHGRGRGSRSSATAGSRCRRTSSTTRNLHAAGPQIGLRPDFPFGFYYRAHMPAFTKVTLFTVQDGRRALSRGGARTARRHAPGDALEVFPSSGYQLRHSPWAFAAMALHAAGAMGILSCPEKCRSACRTAARVSSSRGSNFYSTDTLPRGRVRSKGAWALERQRARSPWLLFL